MYSGDEQINYIVALVGSSLSLITSGFVIYMYYTRRNLQTFACKLTRYLCTTDFLLSLSFMIPSFEAQWLCVLQAVFVTYFLLSSILWTAAISHALYTVVITLNPDVYLLERRYVVLTYGFPAIALFLPLVRNDYGPSEGWCWISSEDAGAVVMRFICFYVPLVIVIVFNVYQYRKIIQELEGEDPDSVSKRLRFYPWILIFTQIALTVHRLIHLVFGITWMPLAVVGVLTTTLMGFSNAVLYGFNDTLIENVHQCFSNTDYLDNSQETLDRGSLVHTSLNR